MDWTHVAFTSLLLVAVAVAVAATWLAAGRRSERSLRQLHESLAARLTELQALHAIGRELPESLEGERVFRLLDRECRKILDADACFIALADAETSRLRRVFSRVGDKVQLGESPVFSGLAARVLHQGSAQRVEDVREEPTAGSLQANLLDPQARSAMAVPLVAEGRTSGVLAVESRRPRAYDEHQLAVLATIGQQAAVAIESVRHYRMATVDSLTGFFLKDYFFRRLDQEDQRVRRYGGKFALLMLDLDGFKTINDRHGHLVGDRFLAEITLTIRRQLRAADMACRYGGDEFSVLLPETELGGARAIAERVRSAVATRIVIVDGLTLRTTVSIGLAAFPDHDAGELRILMRKADDALYRAKRLGRDRVVPCAA